MPALSTSDARQIPSSPASPPGVLCSLPHFKGNRNSGPGGEGLSQPSTQQVLRTPRVQASQLGTHTHRQVRPQTIPSSLPGGPCPGRKGWKRPPAGAQGRAGGGSLCTEGGASPLLFCPDF